MATNTNYKTTIVLPLLILLLFQSCNQKEKNDLSKSGMFLGNIQHTGNYNSSPIKNKPSILWKVKTKGQVISSPVIVNNSVYVGSQDQKMYAINALTGKIKWTFKASGAISSTVAVAKGKVMFLSYDGNFYALNQKDGKLAWKFKTQGESVFNVKDYYNGSFKPDFWDFYLSSAVVYNDHVYFGSSDSNVYSLNIDTGEKVWSYKTESSIHSSPAIYENSLVIGSWDSRIYCIDINTGKENWSYTTGRDIEQYIWLGIQASPSIEKGVVYIGSRDAKFYALNIKSGDTLWTNNNFDKSWMPSSSAIDKENIYTGSSDSFNFYSINKKSGKINYTTKTNSYTFSSPAIDNEMAYIGSANGRLYGIELTTGNIKWEFQTIGSKTDSTNMFKHNGEIDDEKMKALTVNIKDMPSLSALYNNVFSNSGAILTSPIISNQIIYFGSSDGFVYALTDK